MFQFLCTFAHSVEFHLTHGFFVSRAPDLRSWVEKPAGATRCFGFYMFLYHPSMAINYPCLVGGNWLP